MTRLTAPTRPHCAPTDRAPPRPRQIARHGLAARSGLAATLALAIAAVLGPLPAARAAAAAGTPSVLVQLAQLRRGSMPRQVTAYGHVEPSSAAQQTLMAPVAAVVARVYVRPGQEVAKGAPLIRLTPSPQTASAYAQAQSALHTATDLAQRTRRLLGQHLASAQQLASALKSEADARSALAALRAQGAGAPNVLHAAYRAIVTSLSTSPGAIVTEGTALLALAAPQGLVLRVGLVPAQASAVTPGDAASVTLIGASTAALRGQVLLRGSEIDPNSGLVPVDIALPPGAALPGQGGQAVITTGQIHGYIVPHAAILVDNSGAPYVVQAIDMKAKKVAVQLLAMDGDQDVIGGPLNPTAPVVLAGNHQLENGMKVRLADPGGRSAR